MTDDKLDINKAFSEIIYVLDKNDALRFVTPQTYDKMKDEIKAILKLLILSQ